MISTTVQQISSNLANIQSLLQHGLQTDHPDLLDTAFSALDLNVFSRITGQGSISLLGQLHKILPYCCDPQLEVYFVAELFASNINVPISNPEALVAQALEHFEHFEDLDLKCRFYRSVAYYHLAKSSSAAMHFSNMAISLATSSGNTKAW
ncbi:hypothetical protein MVEN_01747200 [Mycena venus]|uniref:Uncharacterized protein n=1 Tax=Mycena venus TaxID=2733690 RepID=A0A8H7CMG1_9AGAR|nr:hypothetical protein MVEN_01747200 [Mycena venus]